MPRPEATSATRARAQPDHQCREATSATNKRARSFYTRILSASACVLAGRQFSQRHQRGSARPEPGGHCGQFAGCLLAPGPACSRSSRLSCTPARKRFGVSWRVPSALVCEQRCAARAMPSFGSACHALLPSCAPTCRPWYSVGVGVRRSAQEL
jgi:hypothetical protein